jgi:hypothetical protein
VLTTIVNMGSLTLLMPTTPFKQRTSDTCTARNSCDVPTTTKTMTLSMTFTSSLQLTPCQQAWERSTTSLRSHDISERSDTPRTSNRPLRNTTVALTQVYAKDV